ncbi:DUF6894 family protein [Agrobacterium rubi]|uniref:DUF6894 domain-containing protein n=1 Tax=Agrobacterium rubi TaxID=28099 RepID=A0AAE7USF5_9HYPH|nr:hypothetical protein [Agrobacterium rubi]MCL6652682.1 hypothetical protein [Agrobacterium rubi]NTE87448.1 hypothetical protein [Agrobacterium rubi]NTF03302.1 hypothetical protein [Agrobacterium rubi]NTF09781.1 hypothetical protein [Agrobacterium rubi]NTF22042.1 hypothetical protein [Agrobacterium rubi]
MSRYYFNIRSGNLLYEDPEGDDYASIEVAVEEAIAASREMTAESVKKGELVIMRTFEITDTRGQVIATVPFSDAIKLK